MFLIEHQFYNVLFLKFEPKGLYPLGKVDISGFGPNKVRDEVAQGGAAAAQRAAEQEPGPHAVQGAGQHVEKHRAGHGKRLFEYVGSREKKANIDRMVALQAAQF